MTAPESSDPRAWLAELDGLEAAGRRLAEWQIEHELDGAAAAIRRACDAALGHGDPLVVEVAPGHVIEVGPDGVMPLAPAEPEENQ